jgi:hypothetical protein
MVQCWGANYIQWKRKQRERERKREREREREKAEKEKGKGKGKGERERGGRGGVGSGCVLVVLCPFKIASDWNVSPNGLVGGIFSGDLRIEIVQTWVKQRENIECPVQPTSKTLLVMQGVFNAASTIR